MAIASVWNFQAVGNYR